MAASIDQKLSLEQIYAHSHILEIFLTLLIAEGFQFTLQDYQLVESVLGQNQQWSASKLKAVLQTILAKTPKQQEIFSKKFDEIFSNLIRYENEAKPPKGHPLENFLKLLIAEGFQFTLQDYQLVESVLGQNQQWSASKLKAALQTILAKTLKQQKVFSEKFENHPEIAKILEITKKTKLEENFLKKVVVWTEEFKASVYRFMNYPSATFLLTLVGILLTIGSIYIGLLKIPYGEIDTSFKVVLARPKCELMELPPDCDIIIIETKESYRNYNNIPRVEFTYVETTRIYSIYFKVLFVFLGCLTIGFPLFLLIKFVVCREEPKALPDVETASDWNWDEDKPVIFNPKFENAEHKPTPLINDTTLDDLARQLNYFRTEDFSQYLNLDKTIDLTIHRGGIPSLVYYNRKQIQKVLILEDVLSQTLIWNTIARTVARGLAKRGIPVLFGEFRGSPDKFHVVEAINLAGNNGQMPDGYLAQLSDFDDIQDEYIVLIFSDSKHINPFTDKQTLKTFSQWLKVAWLEMRECRSWDKNSLLVYQQGLPIYPATEEGIKKVIDHFAREQRKLTESFVELKKIQPPIPFTDTNEDLCLLVKKFLGDTLDWARICSVLQPISLSLADVLRQEFCNYLPSQRLERLLALPGTTFNMSGVKFSENVLRVLREDFDTFWNKDEQEKVVKFLLNEVKKEEPKEKDSLAYLTWKTIYELLRVKLIEEEEDAKEQLRNLSKSPLGSFIEVECGKRSITLEPKPKVIKPLPPWWEWKEFRSSFREEMRIFWKDFNLFFSRIHERPFQTFNDYLKNLSVIEKLGLLIPTILMILVLILPSSSNKPVSLSISSSNISEVYLENNTNTSWQLVKSTSQKWLLEKGPEYRLLAYKSGVCAKVPIKVENSSIEATILENSFDKKDCVESFPELNMKAILCPEDNRKVEFIVAGWKEKLGSFAPKGRLRSIGIEISVNPDDDNLKKLRNTLLSSSGVDVIYQIKVDDANPLNLNEILKKIKSSESEETSQFILWSTTKNIILSKNNELASTETSKDQNTISIKCNFNRAIIFDKIDNAWMESFNKIVSTASGESQINEPILLELAKTSSVFGSGNPIILPMWSSLGPISPKASVHFQDPSQQSLAKNIVNLLKANGFNISQDIIPVNKNGVTVTQVRYFNPTGESKAKDIVTLLKAIGRYDARISSTKSESTSSLQDESYEIWLPDLSALKPRVYLQIPDETMKDLAKKVQEQLEAGAFVVTGIENVQGRAIALKLTELRYYYDEDQSEAMKIIELLKNNNLVINNMPQKVVSTSTINNKITIDARQRHYEIWFAQQSLPPKLDNIDEILGLFANIPKGNFTMGDEKGYGNEKPVHEVIISNSFEMGKYEVTQKQWRAVMITNPSYFKGEDLPVEQVSWDDVQEFIKEVNKRSDKYMYRLPTEAEWEYACRAGSTGDYAGTGNLDDMGWYGANFGSTTHVVGKKQPNLWGLYDMHGNVWEWCSDWYGSYPSGTVIDPIGPPSGSARVYRGGSWYNDATICRSANRNSYAPGRRYDAVGFRLLRTLK